MRFGVVGCGVIGATHADIVTSLSDTAELVAVADADSGRARAFADRYGVAAAGDVLDLAKRSDIDAISICVPSGLHAAAAVAALDAGKHVIIEKPIDITLDAADRIIDAEKRSGRTVTVISQRRFQAAPRFVHDAISAGRLGRVTSGIAESTFWRSQAYYDSGGWRGTWEQDGGGALMNQGVHAVDLLVWMLGAPVEVTAHAGTLAHERIEVEDTLSANVRFASGAIGTITATTAAYPGRTVRLLINGDRGLALIERERLEYFHALDGEDESAAGKGDATNQIEDATESTVEINDAHRAQYVDFIEAVRDDRAPGVTTADGRRALSLVLAIYESARNGGAPVKIE